MGVLSEQGGSFCVKPPKRYTLMLREVLYRVLVTWPSRYQLLYLRSVTDNQRQLIQMITNYPVEIYYRSSHGFNNVNSHVGSTIVVYTAYLIGFIVRTRMRYGIHRLPISL